MAETAIEWATHSWNPVTGCDRVSPGCAHCYALTLAKRLKAMHNPSYQRDGDPRSSGPGFGVTLHSAKLGEPMRWRKPRVVFVNSMSDLFHEEIPDRYIAEVFAVMSIARRHTFQVLTKRPERMRDYLSGPNFLLELDAARRVRGFPPLGADDDVAALPNVWLGVTIENRRYVNRADLLRETPAAVRFISAEPLLGPLLPWRTEEHFRDGRSEIWHRWHDGYGDRGLDLRGIDWLICGGESGPHCRRFDLDWARDLRDACEASGTAFFLKQLGGHPQKRGGEQALLDGCRHVAMPDAALECAVPARVREGAV